MLDEVPADDTARADDQGYVFTHLHRSIVILRFTDAGTLAGIGKTRCSDTITP
jgi:hypothetical protein